MTKEIVRDVRPGLAVEVCIFLSCLLDPFILPQVQSLDLATADKEAFERAVKCYQGSADHEVGGGRNTTSNIIMNLLSKVAIVIHNAGTLGQDGRKITVSSLIFHCV